VPPAQEGVYAYEDKLKKLRKLFYVDMPEQTGDTPPTLGQWLDEMARAQRRIGTPGLPFWRDLSLIFIRYKYLLEKSGAIPPVKVNGTQVATLARNPAQAAAEQQELAEAARTAQILARHVPRGMEDQHRRPRHDQEVARQGARHADLAAADRRAGQAGGHPDGATRQGQARRRPR
jgi:hypothetical protein